MSEDIFQKAHEIVEWYWSDPSGKPKQAADLTMRIYRLATMQAPQRPEPTLYEQALAEIETLTRRLAEAEARITTQERVIAINVRDYTALEAHLAAMREALEWIRNRAMDKSPLGPHHVIAEILEHASSALTPAPAEALLGVVEAARSLSEQAASNSPPLEPLRRALAAWDRAREGR